MSEVITALPASEIGRLAGRIIARSRLVGDCWVWQGGKDAQGYGALTVKIADRKRRVKTHRLMYAHAKGGIPEGRVLDHLCRNPSCCNPDHLEAVTQRENLLRGNNLAARRAAQTHCKWGHEFTPENTYRDHLQRRVCRTCRAELDAKRYAKRKQQQERRA